MRRLCQDVKEVAWIKKFGKDNVILYLVNLMFQKFISSRVRNEGWGGVAIFVEGVDGVRSLKKMENE